MNFKKKLYSSIVACSIASTFCAQEVDNNKCAIVSNVASHNSEPSCTLAQLNTEHIEKYTAEIYTFMKWNKYARIGCIATATTLAATGAWVLWSGTGARLIEATNFTEDLNQLKQDSTYQKIVLSQVYNNMQLNSGQKAANGAQTKVQLEEEKGWIKKAFPKVSGIVGGFLNIVMMNALGGYIANQLYGATHVALRPLFQRWDAIFGAQGIVWFISQKTRIKQLLGTSSKMIDQQQTEGTLLTLAQDLATAETVKEQELIITLLIQNMNLLTIEFEKLLAYMHYKEQTCGDTFYASRNGMKVICQRATHNISTFINDIQAIIVNPECYNDLEKTIITFIRSLNAYKAAFDNHERAIEGLI